MADRKKSDTYIQEQLYINRIANSLQKDNDTLRDQNTFLRNELRRLGFNIPSEVE